MYNGKEAVRIIAVFMFFFIYFQFTYFTISGESMMPNYEDGQIVFVDRWCTTPDSGDVIVTRTSNVVLIKRVVAKGGDCVEIRHNHLYVNGKIVDEDYLEYEHTMEDGVWKVPEDCYFVMGDNRDNSCDSRDTDIGFVKQSEIIGSVIG